MCPREPLAGLTFPTVMIVISNLLQTQHDRKLKVSPVIFCFWLEFNMMEEDIHGAQ